MTPEKKQKINRTIAKAMGDKVLELSGIYYTLGGDVFNPIDSVSDAMEAVDKTVDGDYDLDILRRNGKDYEAELYALKSGRGWFQGRAETRSAALSLAIMKYLEEIGPPL